MRDRDLVRLYWPSELRPAFDALFAIEDALLGVASSSSQPALGAVRMAWWRDSLERLDHSPPPPEPRLQAFANELLPRGVAGADVAAAAQGYAALFEEQPPISAVEGAGAAMFHCCALLLGADDDPMLARAGDLYALARVRRFGLLADLPDRQCTLMGHRFAKGLRPVTGLARLAARDLRRGPQFEPEATPGRAAALLAHRLTGTIA